MAVTVTDVIPTVVPVTVMLALVKLWPSVGESTARNDVIGAAVGVGTSMIRVTVAESGAKRRMAIDRPACAIR